MTTLTKEQREKREAAARRKTSIHEAGHAIVAQAFGYVVNNVTIRGGPGGGFCDTELPPHDSLDAIKRELSFILAGELAVALETNATWIGDWHETRETIGSPLMQVLELESRSPGTLGYRSYAQAAQALLDEDGAAGYHWLDKALPLAADETVRILRERWGKVLGLAERLRREGSVDLGEPERRKRWDASIERAEIGLAKMRTRHAAGRNAR